MRISKEYPPNYTAIKEAFPESTGKACFCFGDTVYNPFGINITPDIMEHEEVHSIRQGNFPEDWWKYYIADPEWRLNEEYMAFGAQYRFMKNILPVSKQRHLLHGMARALTGPIYGALVTVPQAEAQIRRHAKEKI